MELQSLINTGVAENNSSLETRRQHSRYTFLKAADWDFFTMTTGSKSGFIENISEGGCLFRTSELIEHRRWIRILAKDTESNLMLVLVGRVLRREDKMEAWSDHDVSLHRYGIEFIRPLNPVVLQRLQHAEHNCAVCGDASASIPDGVEKNTMYCLLCHLRRACHNLIRPDDLANFEFEAPKKA